MGESGPVVFLLVGLTGSGKTTYALRRLVPAGAVRLSVDEVVYERYGRYGVDYQKHTYFEKEARVVAEQRRCLVELDVVWDRGLDDFFARFELPYDRGEEIVEPGSF